MIKKIKIGNFNSITLFSFLILVGCLLASNVYSQNWGGGNRASSVKVENAKEEILATTKELRGKVVSTASTSLSSVINGIVNLENIKVGDTVTKGQLLATQDSSNLEYNLQLKKNQLANANLSLEELKQELNNEKNILSIVNQQFEIIKSKYDRAKELFDTSAISVQTLETATSSYLASQQQVLTRKQSIDRIKFKEKQAINNIKKLSIEITKLENDIKDTQLKSPINGQLVEFFSIKSGYIRSGERLAVIQNLNDFEIEAEVPVVFLELLKQTKEIKGFDVEGEIISTVYRASLLKENPRTGTQTVRLSFKNQIKNNLQANNASVTLLVPSSKPEPVLTVSKDAIIPISSGQVVFLMKEGKAIKKAVKLGSSVGNRVIILKGVTLEDKIIVRGNELLKDGSSVKIAGKPSSNSKDTKKVKGDKWALKWEGRRGEQTGELIIGKKASFYNGEKVEVITEDNKIIFETPLVLPFGTVTLSFDGNVSSNKINGTLTLKMSNGNENKVPFSGEKAVSK